MRPALWNTQLAIVAVGALALSFVTPAHAQVSPGDVEKSVKQAEANRRQQEEQTARRARLLQGLETKIADAEEVLGRLRERLEKDMPRIESLKTSDDGKRLATDPHFVRDFIARSEETRVTPAQIKEKENAITQIHKAIQAEEAKPNVGFLPDRQLVDEVEEVSKWANTHLALVNRDLAWIDAAVAKAPQEMELKTAKSLQVAMRDELARQEALLMEAKRAGEEGAQHAAAATMNEKAKELETLRQQQKIEGLLRASQTEIQMMRLQNELDRKRRELQEREMRTQVELEYKDRIAALERRVLEAEAQRKHDDAEAAVKVGKIDNNADKLRRIAKFESAEVQQRINSSLLPFTTPGYRQLGKDAKDSIDKLPLSLASIKASGGLNKTGDGLAMLLRIGTKEGAGAIDEEEARPAWQLHDSHYGFGELSSADKDFVRQAQSDLIDFGDIMVERGLLSP
jgi:hypothetical protein